MCFYCFQWIPGNHGTYEMQKTGVLCTSAEKQKYRLLQLMIQSKIHGQNCRKEKTAPAKILAIALDTTYHWLEHLRPESPCDVVQSPMGEQWKGIAFIISIADEQVCLSKNRIWWSSVKGNINRGPLITYCICSFLFYSSRTVIPSALLHPKNINTWICSR